MSPFAPTGAAQPHLHDERSAITFTPRRPRSNWSRSNKDRVARQIAEGRMTEAGLRVIAGARTNGSWAALNDIGALHVPEDLLATLAANQTAQRCFEAFPPTAKKIIIYWVISGKRPQPRRRRIAETVRLAAQNRRPGP